MKKIVGLVAVAALTLAACTSGPTATETGVPTPDTSTSASPIATDGTDGGDGASGPTRNGTGVCDLVANPVTTPVADLTPGTVISAENVTSQVSAALKGAAWGPTGSSLHRALIATQGPKGSELACTLVALPATQKMGDAVRNFKYLPVIAWAHGTIGLLQSCQPSNKPENFVSSMWAGIGPVVHKSTAYSQGALYSFLDRGFPVVATDYFSGLGTTDGFQRYANGPIEGMQVIDSVRAIAAQKNRSNWPGMTEILSVTSNVGVIPWGHSQGGGSALWAGQVFQKYAGDAEGPDRILYNLKGVAAISPATQFTTNNPNDKYLGYHLGNWDMFNTKPNIPGAEAVSLPIGPVLFSYVLGNWSTLPSGANAAKYPYGPTANAVNAADILTKSSYNGRDAVPFGTKTMSIVLSDCLGAGEGVGDIAKHVEGYDKEIPVLPTYDPGKPRFFDLPFTTPRGKEYVSDKGSFGARSPDAKVDQVCANAKQYGQAIVDWCSWLTYHQPGPNGTSNWNKYPTDKDGKIVPLFVASGSYDRVVWCNAKDYNDNPSNPKGENCLAKQYQESVQSAYCDAGGPGSLVSRYYEGIGHFQAMQASAAAKGVGAFGGSDLDVFINKALQGGMKTCDLAS